MTCPPGTLCIENTSFIYFILIIAFIAIGVVTKFWSEKTKTNENPKKNTSNTETLYKTVHVPVFNSNDTRTQIGKYYYDPGRAPARQINIPTRGEPPPYQQVGALHHQHTGSILPLFGRPTYPSSRYWNYYSMLNNYVKIFAEVNGKHCGEHVGCKELFENDSVKLKGKNGIYRVSLYPVTAPRYIPTVL